MNNRQLVIRNSQLVTMNAHNDILQGDIWIENDRIKAIGPDLALPEGADVIDGSGRIVLPGFVQTHVHLCQTLFRGRADDLELLDWLKKRVWPLEGAHDPDSLYCSAMLGIGELIQSGTTTIVDMETVHHTESAFQAIAESGIRAVSGKVMMDKGGDVPPSLLESTGASLEESVRLLEKWHGYDNGRIQYAFTPRFAISCTEALLREVQRLSEQYGVRVHSHASENRTEIAIIEAETGMRNVIYLDHLGLANERLILAHCIWLDEEERRIIKDRGVKISHCPGSNLKLASGIADVPGLLEQGISVSLGADGAPCNNNLDMFHEMRLAALIQKPIHGPTAMNAAQVLRMATIGGAQAIGMEDDIGSLEAGKKADLTLLHLDDFHTFPSYGSDPVSRIVYSATRADVETVIIDGRIVMDRRIMKTMDKAIVLREADFSIQRLLKRVSG